jgi:hypothetical protein
MLNNNYQGLKTLMAMHGLGEWVWKGIRMDPPVGEGMAEVAGDSLENAWVVTVRKALSKGRDEVIRGAGRKVEVRT